MIGNDVVDLTLAKNQHNWKRKGYLDKIFTKLEQNFILTASNSDEMVWNLWSRKEAVYKIIIQKGGERGYYPLKIECLNFDCENGIVFFEKQHFYTKTKILNDLVHTLALENIDNFVKIVEIFNSENLKKINGIPFYEVNSKIFSASKSHHGKYERIVFLQT